MENQRETSLMSHILCSRKKNQQQQQQSEKKHTRIENKPWINACNHNGFVIAFLHHCVHFVIEISRSFEHVLNERVFFSLSPHLLQTLNPRTVTLPSRRVLLIDATWFCDTDKNVSSWTHRWHFSCGDFVNGFECLLNSCSLSLCVCVRLCFIFSVQKRDNPVHCYRVLN